MKIVLSITEKIMALLNQYDPEGRYARSKDYRCYSYEADTIAQNIRKNSRVETVIKYIAEMFPEIDTDSEGVKQMAGYVLMAIK